MGLLGISGLPQPSKLSTGAGRFMDYAWPDFLTTNPSGPANGRFRNQGNAIVAPSQTGTATHANAVRLGADCVQFNGNGIDETATLLWQWFTIHFRTTRTAFPSAADPYAVQRVWAVLNFDLPATTADRDCGIEIGLNDRGGTHVVANDPGFGIICRGPGIMAFVARADINLPLHVTELTTPPFDVTDWHHYELRYTAPTLTEEAKIQALIDGTLMGEWKWGAGSILPLSSVRATMGFNWHVNFQHKNTMGLHSSGWIAAPTLDDAL